MILRVLGTILLGGGMLGAAAGWMTIRYLDARRQQIAQRVRRRTPLQQILDANHPTEGER